MRLVRPQPPVQRGAAPDVRETLALARHTLAVFRARARKAKAALDLDALIGDLTDLERARQRRIRREFTAAAEQLQASMTRRRPKAGR